MRLERSGSALACVLALIVACAHTDSPVRIEPHLTWRISDDAEPELTRLGVAGFTDARRPAAGEAPPLRLGWRGLYREGDRRLDDSAFLDPPAEGLRRDAIATLARSGDFAGVAAVDVDVSTLGEGELAATLASARVDYLLAATLEEFAAIQHQSLSLSPLRIGWMRRRFGPPLGRVVASYRLYDRQRLVWSTRVETDYESPGSTISQAALDAIAISNETVAGRLHAYVAADRMRNARVVPLRVMDGCDAGRKAVASLVAEANHVFGREIGIVFRPEYAGWSGPGPDTGPVPLMEQLRRQPPPEGGFVLGLAHFGSDSRAGLPDDRYGLANAFARHALARCDEHGQVAVLTVAHEIGHLLGAVHVSDRASVMHRVAEFDARFFDPLNRRILRTARDRDLGQVIPAALVRRLRVIYRAAARFPDEVESRDLQTTQAALEDAVDSQLGE